MEVTPIIPICGMITAITIFSIPFATAILIFRNKQAGIRERNKLKAELFLKAIEKGVNIPEDLFDEPIKPQDKLSTKSLYTLIGLTFVALGAGITILFSANSIMQGFRFGATPALIGVAFLIVAKLAIGAEKSNEQK